ncbi:MAG: ATP-binding cassette domain-containing protein [Anaerolineales bacterium]|nr:ATP-binding cassette domain-containing protein [Anaerolineales bacterium]
MSNENNKTLIEVQDLKVHFYLKASGFFNRKRQAVKAVDGVTFDVRENETFGLVGESGCGKSTTGRGILQLIRPTAGSVRFENIELTKLGKEAIRCMRPKMQMIFQDSYDSLNPRHPIGRIISDPLVIHGIARRGSAELKERVSELMNMVCLNPGYVNRFPHEFSGGQRQRIGVARALALNPKFIVCDESISALDVSIQAQIVNLLQELQEQFGLSYLFIAHDLNMVRFISNRVAVMYIGKIMEMADRQTLFKSPLHPYTKSLISAAPTPNPKFERNRQRIILSGEVPSATNPPKGCVFNTRCPIAFERCSQEIPEYREVAPQHFVACHAV